MTEHDYEVDVAYDGLDGHKKAIDKNYDLLIVDLKLEGSKDGDKVVGEKEIPSKCFIQW